MKEELLQDITIYHKENNGWIRYNITKASVRNTSVRNRTNTGVSDVDNALIRIFDVDGYGKTYFVTKGDVIVSLLVQDDVKSAPITELRKKYGEENVYQVNSVDKFIFKDQEIKELQHIKIGAK